MKFEILEGGGENAGPIMAVQRSYIKLREELLTGENCGTRPRHEASSVCNAE